MWKSFSFVQKTEYPKCASPVLNIGCLGRSVDIFGTITSIEITNHGAGYTANPSLSSSDSSCLCEGQPGSVPGAFDQCLKLKVWDGESLKGLWSSVIYC